MEYTYLGFSVSLLFLLTILISGKIDYLSPFSLHVVSWFIIFLAGIFVGKTFYPLDLNTFSTFLVWYLIVGSMTLLMYLLQNNRANHKKNNIEYTLKFEKFFMILGILACLATILEIFYVGSSGPNNFFLNLRLSLFLEDYSGPRYVVTPIIYPIMTALFGIALMTRKNGYLLKLLILWQLIFVISSVGKLAVLTPAFIFLVINYLDFRKKIKVKAILYIALLFVTASVILTNLRTSEYSSKESLTETLGVYLYSPIIAFGELIPESSHFGERTFRFFYAITYKTGLSDIEPVITVQQYVYVPFATNVYTIMQPFYQDFGIFGVFYGAIFYGLFYSLIYFKAIQKQGIYIILYSFVSLNMLLGFFAETLLTNLSLNLYLFAITIIFWRFCVVKSRYNYGNL